MNLYPASNLAEKIRAQLAPYCLPGRCEIVGSIRRAREWVNDIDLAVIPIDDAALRARVFQNTTAISDGPEILRTRMKDGTILELFFAHAGKSDLLETTPGNWASVLVCRTGSKEHNIHIATRARELGLKWETMRGLVVTDGVGQPGGAGVPPVSVPPGVPPASKFERKTGDLLRTDTEQDFFAALNLEFIPPALRER